MTGTDTKPGLEPLFQLRVEIAPPQIMPAGPNGERRFMRVTGGEFRGDRIGGVVLPGGSDCQLIRSDGVVELDIRLMLQTDDGEHILMTGQGMRHASDAVMAQLQSGVIVDADQYYFRQTAFFEAPVGNLDWLNRLVAIGAGDRKPDGVSLSLFAVT